MIIVIRSTNKNKDIPGDVAPKFLTQPFREITLPIDTTRIQIFCQSKHLKGRLDPPVSDEKSSLPFHRSV